MLSRNSLFHSACRNASALTPRVFLNIFVMSLISSFLTNNIRESEIDSFLPYVCIILLFSSVYLKRLTQGVTVTLSKGSISGPGTYKSLQLVARLEEKQRKSNKRHPRCVRPPSKLCSRRSQLELVPIPLDCGSLAAGHNSNVSKCSYYIDLEYICTLQTLLRFH